MPEFTEPNNISAEHVEPRVVNNPFPNILTDAEVTQIRAEAPGILKDLKWRVDEFYKRLARDDPYTALLYQEWTSDVLNEGTQRKYPLDFSTTILASSATDKYSILIEELPHIAVPTKEVLARINEDDAFKTLLPHVQEIDPTLLSLPIELAREKTRIIYQAYISTGDKTDIISTDTIAFVPSTEKEGRFTPLRKPKTPDDARAMARAMSNKTVSVVTGLIVLTLLGKDIPYDEIYQVVTQLKVREITDDEIENLISDHWAQMRQTAGGIDYTDFGAGFVEKVIGGSVARFNVAGYETERTPITEESELRNNLKGMPVLTARHSWARLWVARQTIEELRKEVQ